MKKKKRLEKWAAVRLGFTRLDWGAHFVKALKENDMPGCDFMLLAPRGLESFYKIPATYSDATNMMRLILVEMWGWTPRMH